MLSTEAELLDCFRKIDRPQVELASDMRWPLSVGAVLSWSVGPRAFLLFRDRPEARPHGIVFHRAAPVAGDVVAMCEWCHSTRGRGAVALMSVAVDPQRTVGIYLCSDLGCVGRAREQDDAERVKQTIARIGAFTRRCLF